MPRVEPASFLTLHYRLAGPQGDVINTFAGRPATLSLGAGELAPAVEQRLLGLEEGARTVFEIPAGEAYGERNPDFLQWLPRKALRRKPGPLPPVSRAWARPIGARKPKPPPKPWPSSSTNGWEALSACVGSGWKSRSRARAKSPLPGTAQMRPEP